MGYRSAWVPVLPYLPKKEAKQRWQEWLKSHGLGEGDFSDTDVCWNTAVSPDPNQEDQRQYVVKRRALARLQLSTRRDDYP